MAQIKFRLYPFILSKFTPSRLALAFSQLNCPIMLKLTNVERNGAR
jgi:hypothetical protein